ncbi:hypothetical protein NGRA_1461 [Nosema granulosis]|uniref:Uncharacterized protein n=1 Tax=Nosema granulosis TaxID=83296 RepID=A0A9P6GYH3_9MICR|nr:hypothetical protein NGRA_1461 [Nosema granulosis]
MNKLYNEIVEDLILKLDGYSKGEIQYEDLRKGFLEEEVAYSLELSTSKEIIFEVEKKLYEHLREVEIKLKNLDNLEKNGDSVDLEVDRIISHSRMISRNKKPLESYSNSIWYLPFCPNHHHIESLYEEE